MKFVVNVIMHSHFPTNFPLFHFTTLMNPSHPHLNLPPFTSPHLTSPHLHFTSLHFTSLHCNIFMISPTISLRLLYNFPNRFPQITWFAGESNNMKHIFTCFVFGRGT
jgi:hypothetical protein